MELDTGKKQAVLAKNIFIVAFSLKRLVLKSFKTI